MEVCGKAHIMIQFDTFALDRRMIRTFLKQRREARWTRDYGHGYRLAAAWLLSGHPVDLLLAKRPEPFNGITHGINCAVHDHRLMLAGREAQTVVDSLGANGDVARSIPSAMKLGVVAGVRAMSEAGHR
jgi:hypothetical protein